MKAVILAGGQGTRISEESYLRPKPMIEIGGKPILWHIMKIYSADGVNEFVICCGYKGYVIKEYFANYFLHMSDVTFDIAKNKMDVHQNDAEPWKVTLVDTGERDHDRWPAEARPRISGRRRFLHDLRRRRRGYRLCGAILNFTSRKTPGDGDGRAATWAIRRIGYGRKSSPARRRETSGDDLD